MDGKGKVLALDYGSKRIGLASGDVRDGIAFPRDIFENKGDVLDRIVSLCYELSVEVVVIGLPLSMEQQQEENPLMKGIRDFADKLGEKGLNIKFVDERLSSFEAAQKTGEREKNDAEAAQIILQRYFDSLS
ncbi:MAG: Holliday junction resolvase RuvX, partial [bacterium]|nr:Holliday junction resolvase RuvX [bacterium]